MLQAGGCGAVTERQQPVASGAAAPASERVQRLCKSLLQVCDGSGGPRARRPYGPAHVPPPAVTAALFLASLALAGPALGAWIWPLQGEVITPYRNGDDPYAGGQHRGIDIAGALGAPVAAAAAGEVRFAGTAGVQRAHRERPHG